MDDRTSIFGQNFFRPKILYAKMISLAKKYFVVQKWLDLWLRILSDNILVKLRRPFGMASATISLKFHSKMLPKKKSITVATAAVRHSCPIVV